MTDIVERLHMRAGFEPLRTNRAFLSVDGKLQVEAADKIARLSGLLREAREDWIKVGYGASHEDVAAYRDFCARIDAALGTADQPVICTHDGSAVPDDSGGWFCADCGYVSAASQPSTVTPVEGSK